MKNEIEIGDRVLVQQAWEDEAGQYHDEFATVKGIKGGFLDLEFNDLAITEFLKDAEFTSDDVEKLL